MRGFTLIELLVMVGVFLAVSVVIGGTLFAVLRGSVKTTTLDQVRQNGDFAISTISRTIRSAKLNTCTPNSVVVVASDNSTVTFSCEGDTISQNGSSLMNTGPSGTVSLVPGTCSFSCTTGVNTPATVTIKFGLSQPGSSTFPESKSTVDFETSVTLRNP